MKLGPRLSCGALALCAAAFAAHAQTFEMTGDLARGRGDFTMTTLQDGKVLVASGWLTPGGFGCPGRGSPDATAELYDPLTGTFSPTAGSMTSPRWEHSATRLADGRVLLMGGATGCVTSMTATSEIYDPVTRTFTATGSMSTTRKAFPSALLPDGSVLAFAGTREGNFATATGAVERFDPATGSFSIVGSMIQPRGLHGICALPEGRFLLMGGMNRFDDASPLRTRSAEIYDPATHTSRTVAAQMVFAHPGPVAAIAIAGGRCLITSPGKPTVQVEVFDAATETFTAVTPPAGFAGPFANLSALTPLADGRVLLTPFPPLRYEPVANTLELLESIPGMPVGQGNAAALDDGRVLIASGNVPGVDAPVNKAFLFVPENPHAFLSFPLRNLTPEQAPMTSAMDHSVAFDDAGPHFYANSKDKTVVAFTGERGSSHCGKKVPECTNGGSSAGYAMTVASPEETLQPFHVNGKYTGTDGMPQFLNYDGHPGYDFPGDMGVTEIVAPADGIAFVPDSDPITSEGSPTDAPDKYNILAIDHGNGYSTWYLHLGNKAAKLDYRRILCPGGQEIAIAAGQRVPVQRDCRIGFIGDKGAGGPHLHFEVRVGLTVDSITGARTCKRPECFPVDPYGWAPLPSAPEQQDPYAAAPNWPRLWAD